MDMILTDVTFINDGQQVDKAFVTKWDISDYCDVYNRIITISFVGVVVYKE